MRGSKLFLFIFREKGAAGGADLPVGRERPGGSSPATLHPGERQG